MSTGEDLLAAIGEDVLNGLEGVLTEVKEYLDEHANDRLGHKLTGKIELLLSMLSEIEEEDAEEIEDDGGYEDDDGDWAPAPGEFGDDEAIPFADAHAAGEEDDDEGDDEEDPV